MQRVIIAAISLSVPGTMGGNSKITLELARHLRKRHEVHFIVPRAKLPTVKETIPDALDEIKLHILEDYPGNEKFAPIGASNFYTREMAKALGEIGANARDVLFSCSDFHVDTIPAYRLQKHYGYVWIASIFLFVPFIFENLRYGYKFPALKYLVYWIYQRLLFALIKRRASAFVVTNKSDFPCFPKRLRNKVLAFYGGVNVEQIPTLKSLRTRDVVFCSRIHPQKGLDGFLDVWKTVQSKLPNARLTVIGSGEETYVAKLKNKALNLKIDRSIDWIGYVNNEAKYAVYSEARLFVHPTVFDNNGMVAAEALCTGLPVVMQDLPSLRDVYTVGCVKVAFGDKLSFANAIIELLQDEKRREHVAPSSSEIEELRRQWSWTARTKLFDDWLRKIFAND